MIDEGKGGGFAFKITGLLLTLPDILQRRGKRALAFIPLTGRILRDRGVGLALTYRAGKRMECLETPRGRVDGGQGAGGFGTAPDGTAWRPETL